MSVEALAIALNHSQARGAAKVVLLGIANHINPDNDGAWPSQARLASYANISDRAVRSAIEQLIDLGEIRVEVNAGQSATQYKTNRYWLTLRCPDDCDGTTNHRRAEVSADRVEVFDDRVEVFDNQGGSTLPTNRNTTVKEPFFPQMRFEAEWNEFWEAYPRKVERLRAHRLFLKAYAEHGDAVLKGVHRLAADPNLPPKQYIPHPSTWLTEGRWADEPYPVRQKSKEELEAEERERVQKRNDAEREKRRLDRERELAEQAAFVPPPRCKHDRLAVRCPTCSKDFTEDN